MNKKICVLGSNSFSGQDFIDYALSRGDSEIIGISRSPEKFDLFLKYRQNQNIKAFRYIRADLNHDLSEVFSVLDREKPSMIVNFAAQSEVAPSWEHPNHWFQTNCVALSLLIQHLSKASYLERYLHISSPEVYGTCSGLVEEEAPLRPSTPYAASKAAADLLLECYRKQYNFPLLTVRATNVYGARQQLFKIIPRSAIYLKLDKTIELHGGGAAVKSYIHIRDISKGEFDILERGKIGEIYHLSPDQGVSVKDLVKQICEIMGASFDNSVKVVEERPGQDAAYVIDSTKARRELGWQSNISLSQGLEEVVTWTQENWNEIQGLPHAYIHKA